MNYFVTEYELTQIADSIREAGGTSQSLAWPNGFADAINTMSYPHSLFKRWIEGNLSDIDVIHFASLSTVPQYLFTFNENITEVNLQCTRLDNNAFTACTNLRKAELPYCTHFGYAAFQGTSLSICSFPELQEIDMYGLASCVNLSYISLPKCSHINDCAFEGCQNLMSIYLLSTSVVSVSGDPFQETPIVDDTLTGSFGKVYVPASLYSNYTQDDFWGNYPDNLTSY